MTHARIVPVENIQGTEVRDAGGTEIGRVTGLLADPVRANLTHLLIRFDELTGSQELYAVPWAALAHDQPGLSYTLDVDEDKLKTLDGFAEDDPPHYDDPEWRERNHREWETHIEGREQSGDTYFAGSGD